MSRFYLAIAGLVIGVAILASAFVAVLGALLYGTDDDRAFPYVLLPLFIATLLGWAVFVGVYLWSRRRPSPRAVRGRWLLVGIVILPIATWIAIEVAFGLAGNYHHYPLCPSQHLGPC